MNRKLYLLGILLIGIWSTVLGKDREVLWNSGWEYLENNLQQVNQVQGKEGWHEVTLPHTWNAFDVMDATPGYRRDTGWYRKGFDVPKDLNQGRWILYFEGVNMTAEVYVNGAKAGGHIGGYLGFEIDITDLLEKGKRNTVLVKADNSYDRSIVPSQKADFFLYGGIVRDVWLKKVNPISIKGCKVTTSNVSEKAANTSLNIELYNPTAYSGAVTLEVSLSDKDGNAVASLGKRLKISNEGHVGLALPKLKQPHLWEVNDPYLYTLQVKVKRQGEILDVISEKIGYRWFEFKEHGAFYLNGKRLLLRGTHRHEEHAGVGMAMSDAQHRKDMEQIKEMGANFVRLAHYPQDPEIYRACDELGLLVWDEVPWCRGGIGDEAWQKQTMTMLEEMIDQNYNHPSIVIWSLGNEVYWLPDYENGNDPEKINVFLKQLHGRAKALDPNRLTAIRKYPHGSEIVDVYSPSIWAGWYSGVYKTYAKAITESQQKYARFVHAEYGAASHTGRHDESPITGEGLIKTDGWNEHENQAIVTNIAKVGDWSENYAVDLFDWHLHVSENQPDFTGNIQWAFKDFGTPLRPENAIPYVNQKGIVDREGNPKDVYYVFKSYWNTDDPFCYIESKTWTERIGEKGEKKMVCVYSNASEVELLLNGKSMGRKKRDNTQFPAQGLSWEVTFSEGKNKLEAKGFSKGDQVASDKHQLQYFTSKFGGVERIKLEKMPMENGHIRMVATAVDKEGRRCLDYEKKVYFSLNGGGKLVKDFGVAGKSQVIEMANGRAWIELIPEAGKTAVIEVRNQDFKGTFLTFKTTSEIVK
ncbi:glycoside hydrolase family 2 TIM barrel-domain containing protein [Limibacter armeniacum]|uniref:glycoside hydrolase family 2 protein n=1 Tax=Limibacter armeniacum TaxID=466084 RepID=UPI002FE6AB2C